MPDELVQATPTPAPLPSTPLLVAELLSVGTEITVGETVDTNAGEIARSLIDAGLRIGRVQALPDDLDVVAGAFRDALSRADLVVSTGGLGPTPDDLTREAIAHVREETPTEDPELLAWLHDLWARRGIPFPEGNRKQAWLIPSAIALANPNGTAPGWFVDAGGGRVIVALPGPPREMRPMWADEALPRLRERGLGQRTVVRTLRLTGIGESLVADRLGEALLRQANPSVATYARAEAVDVRVAAVGDRGRDARALADEAEAAVRVAVGEHVWATGSTTWAEAIDTALADGDRTLATLELGTRGALVTLLGGTPRIVRQEVVEAVPPANAGDSLREELARLAADVRARAGADVGLALRTGARGEDTSVTVSIATAAGVRTATRLAFLAGALGRHRAAIAAASVLLEVLRGRDPDPD